MEEWMKREFRWFHRNPELSYEEHETTEHIRSLLEERGIQILPGGPETGLVAVVRGSQDGPVRALRCDIDGLPVQEGSGVEYASRHPGKMHACGHDFHIMAGLGAAVMLQERRQRLKGMVKFLFQGGEETSLGALKMIETGLVEDVAFYWGLHGDPTNETGTLGIRPGAVAAAVDRFVITIQGVGCHGAHPDDGADPIPAACALVGALQTIPTRNVNAFHPSLLSVTRITAGNTWNVIPDRAELEGTIRTMDLEDRRLYEKRLSQMAGQVAAAYGSLARVEWIPGSPAVINDGDMARLAAEVGERLGFQIVEEERSLGGDDFSFYQEKAPGCYIKVGIGKGQAIHQPGFRVDLAALFPTARYLAELLMEERVW